MYEHTTMIDEPGVYGDRDRDDIRYVLFAVNRTELSTADIPETYSNQTGSNTRLVHGFATDPSTSVHGCDIWRGLEQRSGWR